MWAQWDRRLTKCTQTESPAHVGPRRLGRAQPLGSMVRALGISCPPGQARPAPDETGLWWSAALALRCYGADGGEMSPLSLEATPMERPMAQQLDDLSRSLTPLEQDSTIIAVIEMSQASWLVAGIVPGIERHPLKKLEPSEVELLRLLMRWRAEATQN